MSEDQAPQVREFDLADELAAVNRFRLIQELEPAFYEKNWQRVCFITTVVSGLAQECEHLPLTMGIAAHLAEDEAADSIRGVLRTIEWDQERFEKFDERLGTSMIAALKLSKEPDFPPWLLYAARVISAGLIEVKGEKG